MKKSNFLYFLIFFQAIFEDSNKSLPIPRRVWEFDVKFKKYLKKVRAYSIDMETATLFSVGFHNRIPTGALLLVTDQPMIPDGIKTNKEDDKNSKLYDKNHLELGIASLREIIKYDNTDTVRHLKF